jgi:hypothetical protein
MEPWKAFTCKAMRWHNIQKRLSLRVIPLGSWIKRMGKQCNQGYPHIFAISIMKKINDFFLFQRHGNLYKF